MTLRCARRCVLRRSTSRALALLGLGVILSGTSATPVAAQTRAAERPRPSSATRSAGRPAARARVVEVAMREVTPRATYRYEPDEIVVRPGDRIRFRVASGQTHNVAFEDEGVPASVRAAWNAALPARAADLTSPILLRGDAPYEIVVPTVPPGRYRFYCLSHRAYNMEGVVRVVAR
jgi:plastocyanin